MKLLLDKCSEDEKGADVTVRGNRAVQSYEIAPLDAKLKSTLINFVNIVATYYRVEIFQGRALCTTPRARHGIVSSI